MFEREGVPWKQLDPSLTNAEAAHYLAAVFDPALRFQRPADFRQHVINEIAFFRNCCARAVVSGFTLSAALSARAAGVPLVVTHMGSFVPLVQERKLFRWSDAFDNWLLDFVPHEWFDRVMPELFRSLWVGIRLMNAVAKQFGIARVLSPMDAFLGDLT